MQLMIGLADGALIAFLAYRAGALSRSGAWAAALSGGVIFGIGGLPWAYFVADFLYFL